MDEDPSVYMLKWGLCTKSAKTHSIRTALSIIWTAWSTHKHHSTIEQWCINALHWKKETLINVLGPLTYAELCSSANPNNLPEETALLVLTKVIPDLPTEALNLLERIIHVPLTTCHYDVVLNEASLHQRVCEITFIVKSFLHQIQIKAQKIISMSIKEKCNFLRNAKKSYRKARQISFKYKSVVEETRKDLQVMETKVKERSQSKRNTIHENLKDLRNSALIKSEAMEMISLNQDDFVNDVDHASTTNDSIVQDNDETGNLLQEDMDSGKENCAFYNPVQDITEDKAYDSDDSVTHEMRTRLYSNASAEKTNMNLEESVAHFRNSVKKLQQDMKHFKGEVNPFVSSIEHSISQVLNGIKIAAAVNSEQDMNTASEYIDSVRRSNIGKYVHRLRQAFLTLIRKRHTSVDLWKWLNDYTYDRVLTTSASPLRLINRYTSERSSMKQLLPLTDTTKFLVVSGPIGSGKSYLVKYLLCKWSRRFIDINCPFDYDALIPVTGQYLTSFQSLEDYIAEILNHHSSTELLHKITTNFINQMRLLFVAEVSVNSNVEKVKELIREVSIMNNGSRVIFTCRLEHVKTLETFIMNHKQDVKVFQLLCLDDVLLVKFVQYYTENEAASRQFCALYEAMNLESNLRHPLFVLISLYLWKRGTTFLASATCLSKLIMSVMIDFHLRAANYQPFSPHLDSEQSYQFADNCVQDLCETVWLERPTTSSIEQVEGLLEVRPPLNNAQELFHPFLIFVEDHCYLAHSAFKELLIGVYLAGKFCEKRSLLSRCCCATLETDELEINKRKLSSECLIVAAGIWSQSENLQQSVADRLATSYAPCAAGNPLQWLRLVGETGQSKKICAAVSTQLQWKTTWNGNGSTLEENIAISELLRIEAYHPNKVIIGGSCLGRVELVSALAICPAVQVVLRMESHFYTWNDSYTCDDLVEFLQPSGNLVELWGHLDVRGVYSLRHMKKLRELNLRVSSTDSLLTLATVLSKLSSLKCFSLRLNIPLNVNLSAIPSFSSYKGKLWIRFWNVTDTECDWVIDVVNKLHSRPEEVHLQHSTLSPDNLQSFKSRVGAPNVYVSM